MIDNELIKEIRQAPELEGVEIINATSEDLNLTFKEGYTRNGNEILKIQEILFKFKLYNFIKSEKVDFWTEELKEIKIYFH